MASLQTISEELRLGTDSQTLVRSFSFTREGTGEVPREEVFAIVELADKPSGGEDLIRTLFQTLQEICFLDQNQDAYERFETALKEINAVIAEFRDSLSNKNIGRLNAVIGFFSGRELHLTQGGEAEAYLIRKGALTTVTEGLGGDGEAVDAFVNIASGRTENRDKLILATERLLRYATKNELTKIFSPHKEISVGLEELDEIIVLEGAQTTGVLALDIVTEAVAARTVVAEDGEHPLVKITRHMNRGLGWIREKLPEGTKLPGGGEMNIDKNYVILGFLVIAILILLSASWSLGSKRSSVKLEEVKAALEVVQTNIDMAKTRRNIGDKPQAYELLKEAELTATDLVKSGLAIEEANTKVLEIQALRDELDNIRRYAGLTALTDLSKADAKVSLVGLEDFHGRKIAFDSHNLFDTALDVISATTEIDAVSTIKKAHFFDDRDAVVFLTADDKIVEWRDGEAVIADTDNETWKSAVDFGTYAKYIYLLDATNNQIWKYPRNRDSYGEATEYNENADLTKAVSIAIDGDIWILQNDIDGDMGNDIIRLRKGEKKPLTISDLPADAWVNPSKIYTNDSLKFVYVLDGANKRILRFYKDPPEAGTEARSLVYNMQYLFADLAEVRDFWIDSSEQKLYVIDSQKIYEVAI
ncbi:hypothetical protein K9N08_02085 [Candidatus Gracilibacteria bacterium]|nr:hypothetical protein [Candidatus Gracilibacteria bacterium]MCF7896681.1 hypothetical protein [Candidatus Gracilibacteria bacterium]